MTSDMQSLELREHIREISGHETLIFLSEEYFDEVIVGVTLEGQVVYDRDGIIRQLMRVEEMEEEDALDHFDYNVHGSHIEGGPIFITLKEE
jgi:hypothetical protein